MKDLLRIIWYWLCRYPLALLPASVFFNLQSAVASLRKGRRPVLLHIKNPKRFNEKLMYLKLHPCIANGEMLADKYRVRDFVRERVGEQYLVPLLGVWDKVEAIDFDSLPQRFALKANHGSGWNIICKDKSELDWKKACKKMKYWLEHTQYHVSREWQYKDCPRRIICEQFLEFNIVDYKFFCFDGEPRYIQIDEGRFTNHRRMFFSPEWEPQPFTTLYPKPETVMERPEALGEMLDVARKLAKGLNFIRVDLYIHDGKVYFGEMTLHPEGGCGFFVPDEYDYELGRMLRL